MTELAVSQATGWVADDSLFGARLALVRQRMGWGNVKEAAEYCDVPVESWRRWERDGRSPRNVVAISALISRKTGCSYLWLLTGSASGERIEKPTAGFAPESQRLVASIPLTRPVGRRDATRRPPTMPRKGRRPQVMSL